MWKIIAIAVVIALLGGAALVGAANAAAPGDLLYALDRGMESLQARLASGSSAEVQFQLQAAQERLAEAQELSRRGDAARFQHTMSEAGLALQALTQAAGTVQGEAVVSVMNQVDVAFDKSVVLLDDEPPADSPHCNGTATADHPVGAKLAERFNVSYAALMAWYCAGFGFGEIDLAYQISAQTAIPVADLFAQAQQGLGWGEIMQTAGILKGNGENEDDEEDGEDDDDADKNGGAACAGELTQPHIEDLAAEFETSYAEVLDWFCQGYGLGEIKLAYAIHRVKGVAVSAVFAQREAGLGWGEILRSYDLHGNPDKGPKEDKGKPEDTPGKGPGDKGNSNKDK